MASVANPAFLEIAVVTPHPSHKVPPTLGPGKITPAILIEWEENAQHFLYQGQNGSVEPGHGCPFLVHAPLHQELDRDEQKRAP